ncbi:Zinc/iron permease [Artemisia annua]|uniref:Zinc/iron permease n=1 Tax=Artemisia annua TaxID=35608 RepID=A0A2U1NMU0_ARTAN|nr:Zinc/iron permease [Artemisia annua]
MKLQQLIFVAFLLSTLITTKVFADCTCEPVQPTGDKNKALKFKLIALASILISGSIGVSIPFAGKIFPALRPEKDGYFVVKAFAAGVILATAFIHILPQAFESLTSPCLKDHPWADFPFTGFVAMVATIMTLLFETSSEAYQVRAAATRVVGDSKDEEMNSVDGGLVHASHGHVHGSSMLKIADGKDEVRRYRIVSQVLELGIIVHSVIIGLSLGASKSPKTIRPLIAALSFHQFFEGLGLGGSIFQAKIKSLTTIMMGTSFALTTPSGIVIGILISNTYYGKSSKALVVEGVLNAASAGILIYMALVDLLSPDFKNPRMQNNKLLLLSSNVSLFLGTGLMSLLAKWA